VAARAPPGGGAFDVEQDMVDGGHGVVVVAAFVAVFHGLGRGAAGHSAALLGKEFEISRWRRGRRDFLSPIEPVAGVQQGRGGASPACGEAARLRRTQDPDRCSTGNSNRAVVG